MAANPYGVLVVSNTVGSRPAYDADTRRLEDTLRSLRIPVFRQYRHQHQHPGYATRKPLCAASVLAWFRARRVVNGPDAVVVVGDRLATDVLLASRMGAWSVWCRDGVTTTGAAGTAVSPRQEERKVDFRGRLAKMEGLLEWYLREERGLRPRVPHGWEEDGYGAR
jgi:phosphatidylglycerophosphatase GEP4